VNPGAITAPRTNLRPPQAEAQPQVQAEKSAGKGDATGAAYYATSVKIIEPETKKVIYSVPVLKVPLRPRPQPRKRKISRPHPHPLFWVGCAVEYCYTSLFVITSCNNQSCFIVYTYKNVEF
jgi:hypothetical protein